jgi:hypothetical protein
MRWSTRRKEEERGVVGKVKFYVKIYPSSKYLSNVLKFASLYLTRNLISDNLLHLSNEILKSENCLEHSILLLLLLAVYLYTVVVVAISYYLSTGMNMKIALLK